MDRVYFTLNNRLYYGKRVPEGGMAVKVIEAENSDACDPETWQVIFGGDGYMVYHFINRSKTVARKTKQLGHRPKLDLPENRIKELYK